MGKSITAGTLTFKQAQRKLIKSISQRLLSTKPAAVCSEQRLLSVTGRTGQGHTVELFQGCTSSLPWPSQCQGLLPQPPSQGAGWDEEWESQVQVQPWAVP